MSGNAIKTIVSADGDRRVCIFQRQDGLFSFIEEKFYQPEFGEPCWVPVSASRSVSLPLCDTLDIAEREAATRIHWLAQEGPGSSNA